MNETPSLHYLGRAIDIVPPHAFRLIDEARAELGRRGAEWKARKQAANLRRGEWLAALAAVEDPTLRAVIDLHARGESGYERDKCQGCDQGCSCDDAAWPCSTIKAILKVQGVDTTDINLANWWDATSAAPAGEATPMHPVTRATHGHHIHVSYPDGESTTIIVPTS